MSRDSGTSDPAQGVLWIDWGRHTRTRNLARRMGVPVQEIVIGGNRLVRYARSMGRTLASIREHRPNTVIATNPSIALGYFLLALRPLLGFRLVSDAHYVGVVAPRARPWLQRFLDLHNRNCDLVIVTTPGHARLLEEKGSRPYVCPDPVPDLHATPTAVSRTLEADRTGFLICSFDSDEPFQMIFEAFKELKDEGFTLRVSGKYQRGGIDPAQYPWVHFLGFVPEDSFYDHLRACSLVIDLTDNEDCLVCGAYEALALHKPLVLSDSRALREYFGSACRLTGHSTASVAEAVRDAFERREALSDAARSWVESNEEEMQVTISRLREILVAGPRQV